MAFGPIEDESTGKQPKPVVFTLVHRVLLLASYYLLPDLPIGLVVPPFLDPTFSSLRPYLTLSGFTLLLKLLKFLARLMALPSLFFCGSPSWEAVSKAKQAQLRSSIGLNLGFRFPCDGQSAVPNGIGNKATLPPTATKSPPPQVKLVLVVARLIVGSVLRYSLSLATRG
ncbi:hypothetical protein TIFTF001_056218 [Ficus carica]|uniref:Uncharacterized protein n=1 Tax=Ficus carica TaxID=3494 RepID=A0AA88JJB0_FICCA|nr:hypothetical protein TIFTF001_056218 [Ficus carica]